MKTKTEKRIKRRKEIKENIVKTNMGVTENKRRKLSSKQIKALIISCSSIVVIAAVFVCLYFLVFTADKGFNKHFNNFESVEVTGAKCIQTLPANTYFARYNPIEEIYITGRSYYINVQLETTGTVYGLASRTEEYVKPIYYNILEINGDYAIVVRAASGEDEKASNQYLDVIQYRGTGTNSPKSLMDGYSLEYDDEYDQIIFVGDLICVRGTLDYTSSDASVATFYDYKSGNELLEVFRLRQGYDTKTSAFYNYQLHDEYLVAYTNQKAYFYNTKSAIVNGFLENLSDNEYETFPGFAEDMTIYGNMLNIYYMGNGWFLRSAYLAQLLPFNGFNICIRMMDSDGELTLYYCRAKADFYNAKTGATTSLTRVFAVAGVANKYNADYYKEQSYLLGSTDLYDEKTKRTEYELPFANPANMIRDGQSIIYFYYLPYLGAIKDDENYMEYYGETTFCIVDEDINFTLIDNALMPIQYVDGVGVQNADPEYSESYGDAFIFDKNIKEKVLISAESGSGTESYTYYPYYSNAYGTVVFRQKKNNVTNEFQYYYGAMTNDGKLITDFIYDELTYFSNGYAIGTIIVDDKATYYRIDTTGKAEKINDLSLLCQEVYVYAEEGKGIGIKNYKGDVIIEAGEYTKITMSEVFMEDGKAVKVYAVLKTTDNVEMLYEFTGSK